MGGGHVGGAAEGRDVGDEGGHEEGGWKLGWRGSKVGPPPLAGGVGRRGEVLNAAMTCTRWDGRGLRACARTSLCGGMQHVMKEVQQTVSLIHGSGEQEACIRRAQFGADLLPFSLRLSVGPSIESLASVIFPRVWQWAGWYRGIRRFPSQLSSGSHVRAPD